MSFLRNQYLQKRGKCSCIIPCFFLYCVALHFIEQAYVR